MRVLVIGATGHIGTYLVPRLVEAGHDVVAMSRGHREPYRPHAAWGTVRREVADRTREEGAGTFGARVRALRADVVIDLVCFETESARHLVEALRGDVGHLLHCGTIWVHGPADVVPTTEAQPRRPIDDYGRKKAEIEAYLLGMARRHGFPATVLHPGHIVGIGWVPIGPTANASLATFRTLRRGAELCLPNFGLETVHHVHADDVAHAFVSAMAHWGGSIGQSFHVVSPAAITLRGFAEALCRWFGQASHLRFLPWEEWRTTVPDDEAHSTYGHLARSSNCSIDLGRRLIGYAPRYSSLEAVQESLSWLVEQGHV